MRGKKQADLVTIVGESTAGNHSKWAVFCCFRPWTPPRMDPRMGVARGDDGRSPDAQIILFRHRSLCISRDFVAQHHPLCANAITQLRWTIPGKLWPHTYRWFDSGIKPPKSMGPKKVWPHTYRWFDSGIKCRHVRGCTLHR